MVDRGSLLYLSERDLERLYLPLDLEVCDEREDKKKLILSQIGELKCYTHESSAAAAAERST